MLIISSVENRILSEKESKIGRKFRHDSRPCIFFRAYAIMLSDIIAAPIRGLPKGRTITDVNRVHPAEHIMSKT